MAARIDGFATERAEFGCIFGDDLVSQYVPLQYVADKDV
jgi:hypothetical protein